MSDRTILYLTDNGLDDDGLGQKFRRLILKAAGDIPIVSVSQKPIPDFGKNVCVGEIGRHAMNMEYQFIVGLENIDTYWVVVAEHDCIYSAEHFNYTPDDPAFFWYNDNVWLAQLRHEDPEKAKAFNGMFSLYPGRRVQSQLIAHTPLLREASEMRYGIETDSEWRRHYAKFSHGRLGEPGSAQHKRTTRLVADESLRHLRVRLKQYLTGYNGRDFVTKIPNIDVRHGKNLTGHRRGKHRRFELEPWGKLEDIMNNA